MNTEEDILIIQISNEETVQENLYTISSEFQTKDWRKSQDWYNNGKQNESEKHQLFQIFQITMRKLGKTTKRLFMGDDVKIIDKRNPMSEENGFEYTENFDGYIQIDNKNMFFNLKFVCDQGGSQTRTLREVYHFIKYQIKYILKKKDDNTYFFNILDGDGSFKSKDKFNYLLKNYSEEDFKYLTKYIYIGDMFKFEDFWKRCL
jgi:hypothetical protein